MIKSLRFLLISTLLLSLSALAQTKSPEKPKAALPKADQTQLEQRLRERCEGLYTAMRLGHWREVESFLDEDAKVAWAPERKIAIFGFTIKSVSVSADGKTGTTELVLDQPLSIPGFPFIGRTNLPKTVDWAWENNEWYALMRGPSGNPIAGGVPPVPALTPSETPEIKELEFSTTEYDFKLIRQGEPIHAKFYFTNKSKKAVKAKPAIFNPCLCVTATIAKDGVKPTDGWLEIKPGEDGWIDVTMETKEFGGYVVQGLDVIVENSDSKASLQMVGTVVSNNRIIPKS